MIQLNTYYLQFFSTAMIINIVNAEAHHPDEKTSYHGMYYLTCLSIWLHIFSLCLLIYYYFYYKYDQKQNITKASKKKAILNQTNAFRNREDLPKFTAIKPTTICFIFGTQSRIRIRQFINDAVKTNVITIKPVVDSLDYHDCMCLHIELVQETETITGVIEYIDHTDFDTDFQRTLQELFFQIFTKTKTIQTWGNLITQLQRYIRLNIFSSNQLLQCNSFDVQEQFKVWYNNTFPHATECPRNLKYDATDDPLCSCAHRPYKRSSDKWLLTKAILYTFDQQLQEFLYDVHECAAITKLAHVLTEKWSMKQLNSYKEQDINIQSSKQTTDNQPNPRLHFYACSSKTCVNHT